MQRGKDVFLNMPEHVYPEIPPVPPVQQPLRMGIPRAPFLELPSELAV